MDTPSFSLANAAVKKDVLHSFVGGAMDGSTPISGLSKVGNLLYGTSGGGGRYGKGTVFSISPTGTGFTVLYSFKGKQDGRGSASGLTYNGDTLYGTTEDGGTGKGTVFSVTPAGKFTTLYSFKGGSADGAAPVAPLTNFRGTLYGTTASGGNVHGKYINYGTVFSISASGQEKVLYFFGSTKDDGIGPRSRLVPVGGKLYGTTNGGGIGGVTGNGTIFGVTTHGEETVLYRFKNKFDGSCSFNCYLNLVGGVLYGTAYLGGTGKLGSVFSVTQDGAFKTLYSASKNGNAGGNPNAALTTVNGTLYGTMSAGPIGKSGTVFSITTGGALKILHTFSGGDDGGTPSARLLLDRGNLYGATAKGGSKNLGTIYSVSGF
jgi:uncharacterized repeat protein (TIGR03803 family)